ncbi:MAG: cysteine desulfurase family protein [Chitinophagales bacterium]|nr:cysteine desulfurase family protein [Chitinophagales bacterium]
MNSDNNFIYFDNNATTQVDKRVFDAMAPFFLDTYANAHSHSHVGMKVNKAVEQARSQVADLIGAEGNEIIFTSGATESINMALKGIAALNVDKGKHIITVATEHRAVLDTCSHLETQGFEITYLGVDSKGVIQIEQLKAALRSDTILVCVMQVNNETGVIQPIEEIAALIRETNALFFTDATQAAGKIDIDVQELNVDFLCLSAHKIHGPKGIGALYVKSGVKIPAYIHGGGHEKGLRSGTLNVPGIIALGAACQIAKEEMLENAQRIGVLRDQLERGLLHIPGTSVNGNLERRIYNVTNICFKGNEANVLMGRMKDVAVSNGSACTSAVEEPSHVLMAMRLNADDAFASIRFSLGKFNTEQEVTRVIDKLSQLTQTNVIYA